MPIFVIPGVFFVIASIYNLSRPPKIKVKAFLFPAFCTFALMLIGNDYGIDIPAYKLYYKEIESINFWEHHVEIGYAALMEAAKRLDFGFHAFLFIVNVILFYSLYTTCNKYSCYIALSWLIIFSAYSGYFHTILRQGVALSFTIYSLKYIISKNLRNYVICCLIAICCHYSAVFFFPAYWIANRTPLKLKTGLIILALLFPTVLLDTTHVINRIAGIIGINPLYINLYLDSQSELHERAGLSLGLIIKFLCFLIYAVSYKKNSRTECVLYNLNLFYLIVYLPLSSISMLSARGLDYYKIFECISLPYSIYNQKNMVLKWLFALFIISYCVYSSYINFIEFPKMESALYRMLA